MIILHSFHAARSAIAATCTLSKSANIAQEPGTTFFLEKQNQPACPCYTKTMSALSPDTPIPSSLAPFFQEYDLGRLDPRRDSATIIERTLQYGNRVELRWLFSQYPREQIRAWIKRYGKERLPHPHLDFWKIVLEIEV